MIQSFRDLEVYQKAYALALEVYRLSESYPPGVRYSLAYQMQKASMSIPLNIAEGYGKKESAAEFKRYLRMALGSANEMEVLVDLSRDLGYLEEELSKELLERYTVLRKQLYRLGQKWS